ncbi:prenyltransferase/squalene oxidase repeat-containing protein [Streptomyces sp. Ru87]|uniref:prenyltransferase/squalene oxidase repeat-containing protein n=1 Tax=Streptomyces sp. Ru87 TaxID=2044307 RepID=UPI000BF8CB48|nr:prenyltransferase/squalene oxidase repeat-containing protein [Streptomyces sp. Ru87]PGH50605.1 hypothetical protein CRI70_11175 [Streptomyces sp. Ru87]
MNVRRTAAALAASAVAGALAAPAASAAPAAHPPAAAHVSSAAHVAPPGHVSAAADPPAALYGDKDPAYDGVWRQSTALLALDTAGVTPAREAVRWLVEQQCDSGGFAPYRADPARKCDAKTPVDSNATAAAVQALAALGGHAGAVEKAVGWLKSVQNEDGGWGYAPGGASDTNSTAVVIGALASAGEDPDRVTSGEGRSAYDGLLAFQLGCDAGAADRGAFAYQPDKKGGLTANDDATVAGALAGLGEGFVVDPPERDKTEDPERDGAEDTAAPECGSSGAGKDREPGEAAAAAADRIAATLEKDGRLSVLAPGADKPVPDPSNTAEAVIALAAAGRLGATEKPLAWLEKNSAGWTKDNPAGLGMLVLAAHATGDDPRSFGGTDLVERLAATGPEPEAAPAPEAAAKERDEQGERDDDSETIWWIMGAGLVGGIGIGLLLSGRKKRV